MTKENLRKFREGFEMSVKSLETVCGIKINLGNIRFSDSEFSVKLTAVSTEKLVAQTPVISGLPIEAKIGLRFTMPGKRSIYTITGFNPRAPKFNLEVKTDAGASYRMPASQLSRAILVN